MNEITSVLRFENYVVKKAEFEYNIDYEETEDSINIQFDIDADFKIKDDGTELIVFLNIIIFDNPIENNYPFKMRLDMIGLFTMRMTEGEDINSYKENALAILFPYARSLVSSYTANANVPPLILPTINVNKYLTNKRKKNR